MFADEEEKDPKVKETFVVAHLDVSMFSKASLLGNHFWICKIMVKYFTLVHTHDKHVYARHAVEYHVIHLVFIELYTQVFFGHVRTPARSHTFRRLVMK